MAFCFFCAVLAGLAMEALVLAYYLAAIPLLMIVKNNQSRPKVAALVMSTWAMMGVAGSFVADVRHYRDLHAAFPIESLAERLSYENPQETNESQNSSALDVEPQAQVLQSDEDRYAANRARRRQNALKELHSQTFSDFVAANGFGASRMRAFQRHELSVPWQAPAEPLPKRPEVVDPPTAIQNPALAESDVEASLPLPDHPEAVYRFTANLEMAYIPARQQAAGFVSHAMTKSPAIYGASTDDWQISRLDLVSLLKFDSPRVYLSEHLPRMEALRNAETRPVDEFEQRALEQLRGGEDIVVDQQLNTIRMVGAIRAAKKCLDCHSVRRGELLGAFSYLLDRKKPIAPEKVEGKPLL